MHAASSWAGSTLERLAPACLVLAALLVPLGVTAADESPGFDLSRPAITAFIDARVAEGANREHISAILASARSQSKILDAMNRPAEKALPWHEYRARFITEERIDTGVKLWREHRDELESIARARHVSPQYILAITGVETFYGRITGRYRVLDALSTLAFDFPPRAAYFQSELAQFLKLADEESLDPNTVLGSYAGAMGVAQFMPSSYRKYAVDAGGKPGRDLWTDWGDVFASIANYLALHGWQYGGSVLADATFTGATTPELVDKVALNETLGSLRAQGFAVDTAAWADTPALVVAAPKPTTAAYRVGFKNFYVITRYNRSPLYAMAVNDLAEALAARMEQTTP
jgi:membrane-bound lytic murein transglycosylase B